MKFVIRELVRYGDDNLPNLRKEIVEWAKCMDGSALLRRPAVSRVVSWTRAKAHRPPLWLPPAHDAKPSPESG